MASNGRIVSSVEAEQGDGDRPELAPALVGGLASRRRRAHPRLVEAALAARTAVRVGEAVVAEHDVAGGAAVTVAEHLEACVAGIAASSGGTHGPE